MESNIILPKSWDEISYPQYLELKELDESDSSFFTKYIEILAILTDTTSDDEIWEDMDVEEVSKLIKELKFLKVQPKGYKKQIGMYHYKDINKLTLGEFIDLEYYFSEDYLINLPKIAAIFYRQIKLDDWDNIIWEPYDNIDLDKRSDEFYDIPITNAIGLIDEYLRFKELFHSTYVNLFEPTIDESDEELDPIEEMTPEDIVEEANEKKQAKWSWETILHNLSNGDLTKYNELTNLPVIFIFNQLSFRKDLNL